VSEHYYLNEKSSLPSSPPVVAQQLLNNKCCRQWLAWLLVARWLLTAGAVQVC